MNFCYSDILNHFRTSEIMLQFENELVEDISDDPYQSNREKLFKIGLSALFPGLGHFYARQYKIGAIYSVLEIVGWMGRDHYLSKAKDSSAAYKAYAKENWSLAYWFKYYFNPFKYFCKPTIEVIKMISSAHKSLPAISARYTTKRICARLSHEAQSSVVVYYILYHI